jgi:hypothetical protein
MHSVKSYCFPYGYHFRLCVAVTKYQEKQLKGGRVYLGSRFPYHVDRKWKKECRKGPGQDTGAKGPLATLLPPGGPLLLLLTTFHGAIRLWL